MTFAGQDHAAAVADLIAFDGRMVNVAGTNMRAHIEREPIDQTASEFGIHNREESLLATIVRRGEPPRISEKVTIDGSCYRIASIEPAGESVLTLTLRHDRGRA